MNNFRFLGHLDTFGAVAGLRKLKPHEWAGVAERGEMQDPTIGLGASRLLRAHRDITKANWLDDLPVEETDELVKWPIMKGLLTRARRAIMADDLGKRFLTGEMARAMISRLDPGSIIFWHVDDGPYHGRTIRFHLPLVTNPGVQMYSGQETIHMPVGSLWYFNNHIKHSAANFGAFHRYHLIFEMYRVPPDPASDDDED